MPEYAVGLAATAMFAVFGILHKKSELIDARVDKLEVKVAEVYVTKEEIRLEFDLLRSQMIRIEDKLDKLKEG
ncbi:hypothetical protein [Synechococcus phage S-N03]|uniref:Uncharacterized protein n=1 Tax=Synechococcus phage S-N03 TaxID=2718943 RepID=A0A6G8R610_9CAUD|nr:hypothetical protein PQC09_gp245 [Synechococcus phage S-N03]QIN96822.1 hypothetical protein [Synechococcus phage S-N03]